MNDEEYVYNAIVDMNERHQDEMQALLKSFVNV